MTPHSHACVVGMYEHPTRHAPDISTAQLHFEVARGALMDAGLTLDDVDAYFCASDAPGMGSATMAEYMGLRNIRHTDSTETGGSAYLVHVGHAAAAIAAGKCNVALITMADRPLGANQGIKLGGVDLSQFVDIAYSGAFPLPPLAGYAAVANRHMYEFGTTSEQLAWVKVAASHHAQHNPHALLRDVVTVEDVVNSPLVADPLHRLDCCVVTDGGGAVVLARADIARRLKRPVVKVKGCGEAIKHRSYDSFDLTTSGAVRSGQAAFTEAGVTPTDIKYVSIYDSFTITVIIQLEDLGFCAKGKGGRFVADGNLISGVGRLPFNTDGGGLCSNHPGNRGGMTKLLEAIRQARGEAHPMVQVPNHDLVLAHGTGGALASYHVSSTVILEAE
jgi:acetyl-CoA C-acetyltransferase